MMPNIYLSDEEVMKLYIESEGGFYADNPIRYGEHIARAAADNAVKQVVENIENPFEGYFDVAENIRMAKSQGFERFRHALKKLAGGK